MVSAAWPAHAVRRAADPRPPTRRFVVADLAYALILISGFALLVLILRGLESL